MTRKLLPALTVTLCTAFIASAAYAQHGEPGKPAATPAASPKPATPPAASPKPAPGAHETKPAGEPGKPAAADKAPAGQPSPEDMQEMMAMWMKLAAPSEGHKRLEPMVGKWDAVVKVYMGGPDAPASESKGEAESEWILGGRFVLSKYKGTVSMGGPPMPFEGTGMLGYDNYRQMYVGNWADSMGTPMLFMTGAASQDGTTVTMYGEMDEPTMKIIGRMVKYVTRFIDKDKYVWEMYDLHVGPDYKVMEITYTRKK
jgi:hypothetical protein